MTPYGEQHTRGDSEILPPTVWAPSWDVGPGSCIIYHLTLPTARALPGLLEFLCRTFAKEIEDGRTYPQEGVMDQTAFEDYFFAADAFLGIIGIVANPVNREHQIRCIEVEKGERDWEECTAGFYYVSLPMKYDCQTFLIHIRGQT
jgi:hypothetical protein